MTSYIIIQSSFANKWFVSHTLFTWIEGCSEGTLSVTGGFRAHPATGRGTPGPLFGIALLKKANFG